MKSRNVVNMKMANKQKNWLVFFNILIKFVNPIASIKHNIIFFAVYKNTGGISSWARIPSISSKEYNFHGSTSPCTRRCGASLTMTLSLSNGS